LSRPRIPNIAQTDGRATPHTHTADATGHADAQGPTPPHAPQRNAWPPRDAARGQPRPTRHGHVDGHAARRSALGSHGCVHAHGTRPRARRRHAHGSRGSTRGLFFTLFYTRSQSLPHISAPMHTVLYGLYGHTVRRPSGLPVSDRHQSCCGDALVSSPN
jgi:hypothetical protein